MWKPVFTCITGHALCLRVVGARAGGGKAPDIPSPGAIGIDVDPFPIRRVVPSVAKARAGSQPRFFPPAGRNTADIELAAALPDNRQPSAVRGPPVEVAGDIGGHYSRGRATSRRDIDL